MASFDDASHSFMRWLREARADVSPKIKLEDLRHVQAGRGVVAVQDIEEDELLFRIPRSAILSVENSILSNEMPASTFENLGPWLSLILVMLYEYNNGTASNWAPYFNVLPSEFNTLMFWADNELAELEASAVRAKIGRDGADATFKNELVPTIKEFAEIFFSGDARAKERAEQMSEPENILLMHKMGSLIMAYAFDVEPANPQKEIDEEGYASEDEDEALPKGMVPLADMLNADADRNNARLFYEEEYLSMKALQPIKAGEEIFNDYGPLPRSDLLRRYGYITDNYAQYDVVEIPSELVMEHASAAGIHSEQRLEYLDEQGVVDSGYDITASSPFNPQESLSPELIVLIETLFLSNEDFERLQRKGKLPKPENITSQGAAFLHRLVQARIQQYPTSLEQDLQDFGGVPLSGEIASKERRYAMAKAVRIGEKTILRDVEHALSQLTGGSNGALKRQAEDTNTRSGKKQREN